MTEPHPPPPELPPSLAGTWGGHAWCPVQLSCSEAKVYRLERDGRVEAYAKLGGPSLVEALADEAERLRWLEGRVDAARVLTNGHDEARAWLVTAALPGLPASSAADPGRAVPRMAQALRALHALPVASCPFDARLATLVPRARAQAEAGLVDEADFDPERRGWTAAAVLRELERTIPADEDLVVAHGDPCLPNLLLEGERQSAWIDVGRLGVSCRWRDLALVTRSAAYNYGPQWEAPLLAAYGVEPDAERLAFYRRLDELW